MCAGEGKSLLLSLLSEGTKHCVGCAVAAHHLSDEWEVLSVIS